MLHQISDGGSIQALHSVVLQALRWMHFFFGIVWLGHLYFFNFVQTQYEKALSPEMKKVVIPQVRGRALWWFRWGAMITLLTGWGYLVYQESVVRGSNFKGWLSFGPDGAGASNVWILFGGVLGTIMWVNVWFVIWPAQQVILGALSGKREKPADFDALVATAGKVSRINAILSLPMLFGMGARGHFPVARSLGEAVLWMLGVLAVGVAIAVHVLKLAVPRVGREFLPDETPKA
jgi:uncharacterized membrane protein